MTRALRHIAVALLIAPFGDAAIAGDVRLTARQDLGNLISCEFVVSGEIDAQTPQELRQRVREHQCSTHLPYAINIRFNSGGGDVIAAMQLGEYLRAVRAHVAVGKGDMCASACVLAFTGGIDRFASGQLGLHRPYEERLNETSKEAAEAYDAVNKRIGAYLRKMNVPTRLLDEMNAVSPSDIKWLDASEMSSLHLVGIDPVFEDKNSSQLAKERGISKKEYYRRAQLAKQACDWDQSGKCEERTMQTGIPLTR